METNTQTAGKHAEPDVACSATLDRGGRTPGPWRVEWPEEPAAFVSGPTILGSEGQPIAEILSADVGEEPSEMFGTNDARLIAAAPELLTAAKLADAEIDNVLMYLHTCADCEAAELRDSLVWLGERVRATIAKATTEAAA